VEYRLPIVPRRLSLALISDFGNAWSDEKAAEEMIVTAGVEGRIAIGPAALALGRANTMDGWSDGTEPNVYFRLVLINPF
jgi:hypothetical protein